MYDWEDRVGIDGCKSDSRPKTLFETCANKFNDPSLQPASNSYPELHDNYAEPIFCFMQMQMNVHCH